MTAPAASVILQALKRGLLDAAANQPYAVELGAVAAYAEPQELRSHTLIFMGSESGVEIDLVALTGPRSTVTAEFTLSLVFTAVAPGVELAEERAFRLCAEFESWTRTHTNWSDVAPGVFMLGVEKIGANFFETTQNAVGFVEATIKAKARVL